MLSDSSWGKYHGPHVPRLESELAACFGVPHVLTCASGTLAVQAVLHALKVEPGDEVILPAYDYEANFLNVHAIVRSRFLSMSPGKMLVSMRTSWKPSRKCGIGFQPVHRL